MDDDQRTRPGNEGGSTHRCPPRRRDGRQRGVRIDGRATGGGPAGRFQRLTGATGGTTDRGVSPVIGVILMVAITVILAAVIGTFVLGIGSETERTPQATFEFEDYDDDPDAVRIVHEGGDTIPDGTLEIRVAGDTFEWPGPVTAGDEFVVADSGGATGISQDATLSGGDVTSETFRLVYASGDGSTLLAEYEVE